MTTLFKRILVPLDLSDCSRAALRLAFGLAEVHRSEIDVLLVVPSDDSGTDAQRKLQGFVEASGVPATGSGAQSRRPRRSSRMHPARRPRQAKRRHRPRHAWSHRSHPLARWQRRRERRAHGQMPSHYHP